MRRLRSLLHSQGVQTGFKEDRLVQVAPQDGMAVVMVVDEVAEVVEDVLGRGSGAEVRDVALVPVLLLDGQMYLESRGLR